MKRHPFLNISGCSVKRYDNLVLRDQLPFRPQVPAVGFVDEKSERGKKNADYTLYNAFQLRLFLDLTDGKGLSADDAKYVAGNCWRYLRKASTQNAEGMDIWLVFAKDRPHEAGSEMCQLAASALADLPRLIAEDIHSEDRRDELAFVTLVNATAIWESVMSRAFEETNIPVESIPDHAIWLGEA